MASLRFTYAELVSMIKNNLPLPEAVKDIEVYGDLVYITVSINFLIPVKKKISLSFESFDDGALYFRFKPTNLAKILSALGIFAIPDLINLKKDLVEIKTKPLFEKLKLNLEISDVIENNGEFLLNIRVID